MYLKGFLDYLTSEKRYSSHTITAYQRDLDQFAQFYTEAFEDSDFSNVENFHIRSFVAHLYESGISPRSIQRKLSAVQSFFRFLRRRHGFSNDPCKNVVKPKVGKRLPSFIPVQEINRLENDQEQTFIGLRDHLVLLFLYCTGVRVSELAGLKISDIDFSGKTVKVLGKRSKERILPLLPELLEAMDVYLEQRAKLGIEGEMTFVNESGSPLKVREIQRMTAAAVRAAGISSKGNPHVFRHTFATHLLNGGADINAVKELLGHSSLAATQVYTHNTIDKLKRIHQQAHPRANNQED